MFNAAIAAKTCCSCRRHHSRFPVYHGLLEFFVAPGGAGMTLCLIFAIFLFSAMRRRPSLCWFRLAFAEFPSLSSLVFPWF
ncbi:MAG: hypothetical protein ACLTYW_05520 [Collinsella sp.]